MSSQPRGGQTTPSGHAAPPGVIKCGHLKKLKVIDLSIELSIDWSIDRFIDGLNDSLIDWTIEGLIK